MAHPTGPGGVQRMPRSGDVLRITKAASVQFGRPIFFRVIRVHDWETYQGWVWLDGYELNQAGDAVDRRSIFVQPAGLLWLNAEEDRRPAARPAPAGTRNMRQPEPGRKNAGTPRRESRANTR